jgi:hypothetical protein
VWIEIELHLKDAKERIAAIRSTIADFKLPPLGGV